MLYVYSLSDYYKKSEEERKAILECKNLKKLGDQKDNDVYEFIGKEKSFTTEDGKEIFADESLYDWIDDNIDYEWSCIDTLGINVDSFNFSNQWAKDLLMDELRTEDSDFDYDNRVFNSENPYFEIRCVIDELTIVTLETAMEELKNKIRNMKHIDWK